MRSRGQSRGVLAAALLLGALAVVACDGGGSGNGGTPGGIVVVISTPTPTTTAGPTTTVTPSPTPTPLPSRVCSENTDPAPPSLLQVQEPQPEEKVGVPFYLRGWGSTIGKNNSGVAVAVVDEKLKVLQVLNVPPQPRDYRVLPSGLDNTQFARPFGVDIVVSGLTKATPFCIWVYLETDDKGKAKDVVQVPVVVTP